MARYARLGRRGSWITHAAIAAALVCAGGAAAADAADAADAGASTSTRAVTYRGYSIEVPSSWPVHRLAGDRSRCVRFDRPAVYLGHPGAEQRCPADVVGRSDAVLVEPLARAAATPNSAGMLRAPKGSAAPRQLPAGATSRELRVDVPSAGVRVTATWRSDPAMARRIVDGARLTPSAEPSWGPESSSRDAEAPVAASARGVRKGLGFDACTWRESGEQAL